MAFTGRTLSLASSSLNQKKDEEEDEKKKSKKKAASKSAETSSSKPRGGSGMIGGIIEAGAGFVDRNAAKKAARRAENRPKHRRLAAGIETAQGRKRDKERALATLSQAVFDWAGSIR